MQPSEIKAIRLALGLTQAKLGRALGLAGDGVGRTVRRWESSNGAHPATGPARLALAYLAKDRLGKEAARFPVIDRTISEANLR